ncbi:MAG: HAD family phosphatase [Amphritea sp.]|nr:HAD family phosphatase [Amphritea sp.]
MSYKAAVFDMDGLLLDTERVCMGVFEEACGTLALPFYRETYLNIIGRNAAGIREIFLEAYADNCDAVISEWRTRYHEIVENKAIPVKPGVTALLEWLQAKQIPMAVATSTASPVAQKKLKLAGLDQYFSAVATGCEVNQGKPYPEIYQLAASRLGVDANSCLAFEDSNNGVRAAVAAEMFTYQIPDLVEPCDDVRALGHCILPSMHYVLEDLKNQSM